MTPKRTSRPSAARPSEPAAPALEPTAPPAVKAPAPDAPGGKLGATVALLRRPDGATLAELASATGWKPQSVRGALAGALKARGHVVASEVVEGVRRYRLPAVVASADEAQP